MMFSLCFIASSFFSYRLTRLYSDSLHKWGDDWLIRQRTGVPALGPAVPVAPVRTEKEIQKLRQTLVAFYRVQPGKHFALLLLALIIIWLKSLFRFDFWSLL